METLDLAIALSQQERENADLKEQLEGLRKEIATLKKDRMSSFEGVRTDFFRMVDADVVKKEKYGRFETPLGSIEVFLGREDKDRTVTLFKITFEVGGVETFTCPDDTPLHRCGFLTQGDDNPSDKSVCFAFRGAWERDDFVAMMKNLFRVMEY